MILRWIFFTGLSAWALMKLMACLSRYILNAQTVWFLKHFSIESFCFINPAGRGDAACFLGVLL
jgi:hypothetical protein